MIDNQYALTYSKQVLYALLDFSRNENCEIKYRQCIVSGVYQKYSSEEYQIQPCDCNRVRFSENSQVIAKRDVLAGKRRRCGNYKPELHGNNASKDPTNVAREQSYE